MKVKGRNKHNHIKVLIDPLLPSSYRPIALLCTDYKILTSVIAGRFKLYLSSIFPVY